MSDATAQRLEAVCARLEAVAARLAAGGSSAGGAGGDDVHPSVLGWDEFFKADVQPFLDAASKFKELEPIANGARTGFNHTRVVIDAASKCKKPPQDQLMKLLEPIVQVITKSDFNDNRSAWFPQFKAWNETTQSFQWLIAPSAPASVVQNQLESSDFYLIKVLTSGKAKGGAEGDNIASFAKTLKNLMLKLQDYIKDFHKTGLTWNAKGGDLSSYKGGSAPAAPGAPAPPAAPPAPAPPAPGAPAPAAAVGGASGMDAVFASIRCSGDGVTGGLKKVTNDMKTKNMKDAPTLAPTSKAATPAAAAPVAAAAKKDAKLYNSKGTWFVEYYDNATVEVADAQMKENVFITRCNKTQIKIASKVKSITLDSCKHVTVQFQNVVSVFEIINCDRCTIFCDETVPTVSIDKSSGISVNLSRKGVATPPQLVTSNISEVNLVIPGKTDNDDPIEIPLPEQYITIIKDGKLHTECVSHSG